MTQAGYTPIAQPDRNARKIAKLVNYLWANPELSITVKQMMQITDMSQRTFFYHFRKHTSHSPHKYFKLVRLHYVHNDLSSGAGNITQVAVRYNFNHLSEFSALYRQVYGVLPSAIVRKSSSTQYSLASKTAWGRFGKRPQLADLKHIY